jgi:drug/metabolite transporter (DMT)-like permease
VIVAILSRFWLHEAISYQRWFGVVLITVGVGFVAHGPSLTERPADEQTTDMMAGSEGFAVPSSLSAEDSDSALAGKESVR